MMNEDLLERIKNAARATFAIIAPDLFRASENKTLTQAEVIQYVAMYIDYGNDAAATAAFQSMPEGARDELLKEVFPEQEYRWEHKG